MAKPKKTTEAKKSTARPKSTKAVEPKAEKPAKKADKQTPDAADAVPSVAKQEVIAQYQVKEGDTGSPEVQAALLSKRIEKLVLHLKSNPADNHSRRGLLGIVSKRRRLLNYLEKKDEKRYKTITGKLGLGKGSK